MKAEYQVFPHPAMDWRLSPDRHTDFRMTAKHLTSREEVDTRREERIDVPQQLANFARMGFVCLVTVNMIPTGRSSPSRWTTCWR